ncbi:tRNA (adenosine(37)-N6)-dimethylallyltransferase MiaA [Lewinella sp. IMCC34191]|uniref:tRNA (adenosine(37)-N6)-dimethylallyltransferase MiaA n=1 Tax=Lewinella sp. IMCC34191 TaxID=2259172 RepID=UPI000E26D809|nr:tRNA (adenosine(37)-N6)-dimethylallyltransferase MiaA [Lewinella sp. IMCC34191]
MADKPLLIVIGGPTASGKTELAIELARHYGTDIVSADSRQFYREMQIGNARPTETELAAAPHHFIADRSILQPLNAGGYADEALPLLNRIFKKRPVAVMVGGSGLYIRSVCEGLDDFPTVSEGAGAQVERLSREEGIEGLRSELSRLDPVYFERVDRHNPRRMERALRVCYTAGRPYSDFLGNAPPRPFRTVYLQPQAIREKLYDRINRRVDRMLSAGLEEEARSLQHARHLPVLQTVGYQEWWPCFAGEYDRERAVELIKRNSRRYAKRQRTWFRDYHDVRTLTEAVHEVKALTD